MVYLVVGRYIYLGDRIDLSKGRHLGSHITWLSKDCLLNWSFGGRWEKEGRKKEFQAVRQFKDGICGRN